MIASPTLHKAFVTISSMSIAAYYTREDDIEIKFAKDAHNGRSVRLDQQETDEAISQIEGQI